MADYVRGIKTVSRSRTADGHRVYRVSYLVHRDNVDDGPERVSGTTGLPRFGDSYADGKGGIDPYAFCTWEEEVNRFNEIEGEIGHWWLVQRTFTTVPASRRDPSLQGPETADNQGKQHPLDENKNPPEISMSFKKYTVQPTADRNERPILSSSHEFLRGQQNEWERSMMQIRVKQAVYMDEDGLNALIQMIDTVNASTFWGLPPRTVKLSEVNVEWRYYANGQPYYDRTLLFELMYRAIHGIRESLSVTGTGTALTSVLIHDNLYESWDRYVVDEGTKVRKGHWDKNTGLWVRDRIGGLDSDPDNPTHFIRFKDIQDENAKTLLDGEGNPAETVVREPTGTGTSEQTEYGNVAMRLIQYYGESEFGLIPDIPISLIPLVIA